jgi:hypothetical protein
MTDLELLEAAAKAAGINHVDYTGTDYDGFSGLVALDDVGRHVSCWSPLTDDGDAFRLAVKLRLKIYHAETCAIVERKRYSREWISASDDENGDRYAATRRAIVRAAAAIGRAS